MSVIGASLVPLPSGTLVNPSRSVVTTIRRASGLTLRPSTVYEGDASTIKVGVRVTVWCRNVSERRMVWKRYGCSTARADSRAMRPGLLDAGAF